MTLTNDTTYYTTLESPVGLLTLTATKRALTGVSFDNQAEARHRAQWVLDAAPFASTIAQLEEYFAGKRKVFDLPLEPEGTPFQKRVWSALLEIPFGATASYGEQAKRIGAPLASRAVGAANGQNPIAIVVPCHRVVGKSGSLTGFGGGIPRKKWLLEHESAGSPLFAGVITSPSHFSPGVALM